MFVSRTVDTIFTFSPEEGKRFDAAFVASALALLKEEGVDLEKTIIKTETGVDGLSRLTVRRVWVDDNWFESSKPVPMRWAD